MNILIEALKGAMSVLKPNIKEGDTLAIIGSTDVDDSFYLALAAAGNLLGAETTIGLMTPRVAFGRPTPEAINKHIMGANVVVAAPSTSISHSKQCLELLLSGGKWLSLPVPRGTGRAIEMLVKLGDYNEEKLSELREVTLRYQELLTAARKAKIISEIGTNLVLNIDGRKATAYYGIAEAKSDMQGSWPPSESHIAPIEDQTQGIFIVDGYTTGVGLCDVPMKMTVKNGRIIDIEGGLVAEKVRSLIQTSDKNANVVCELGVGTNKYQKEEGTNGDKKVAGTIHVGIGINAAPSFGRNYDGKNDSNLHLDFVLKAPITLLLDGIPVVDKGTLIS